MTRTFELLTLTVIILVITIVLLLAATGAVAPLPSAALLIIVIVAFGVIWFQFAEAARRRRALQVLSYLEQALQNNLPLPRIFSALADEDRRSMGDRRFSAQLNRAREQLEAGAPLARALSEVSGIPLQLIDVVAAAERVGRLPQVFSRLMLQRREAVMRRRDTGSFLLIYPFVVLTVFVGITAMFLIFVIPKFETIFRDFGMKLPWITEITIDIARNVGAGLFILLGMLLIAMGFIATRARRFWPELGIESGPFAWLLDRIPFISRIRAYDALGDTLTFAADAVEAGRPIESALAEAAQVSGNVPMQWKIATWTSGLLRGQTLAEAARSAHLPPLVSGMLATAVRTSDTPQVLQFLGRYYRSRFSRARELLRAAIVPAMSLMLGLAAMWLALSMFMPLIALIQSISSQGSNRL